MNKFERTDNICGAYSKPDAKLTKRIKKTTNDAEKMGMTTDEFIAYKAAIITKALNGEITIAEFNALIAEMNA